MFARPGTREPGNCQSGREGVVGRVTITERSTPERDGRAGDVLREVRAAAEAALEAKAGEGADTAVAARLTDAAKAALDHGYVLAAVAAAEVEGQDAARARLRAEVLRGVARSAKKQRDATAEHEACVARASALGLGAREIADRAEIAHGTVAAIVRRHAERVTTSVRQETSSADGAPTQSQ